MEELWKFNRFTVRVALLLVSFLLHVNLEFSWSLNDEGLALLRFRERVGKDPFGALLNWKLNDGEEDPCFWFGVECSVGKVVSLDLEDLSLEGTLAPEIRNLEHIKSINLRNNSFSGIIPIGIGELKELKVLDLGYNNFCKPLPSNLINKQSLCILLLDNNKHIHGMSSEVQVDENQQSSLERGASSNGKSRTWSIAQVGDAAYRRLLKVVKALHPLNSKAQKSKSRKQGQSDSSPSPLLSPSPTPSPLSPTTMFLPPTPSPSPTPDQPSFTPIVPPIFIVEIEPPPILSPPIPSPSASPSPSERTSARSKHAYQWQILSGAIGVSFISVAIIGIFLCRSKKVVSVKPWVTGLSGQLQKAFITGVPKLKRVELETACEDFSNIIGSSSDGTMYKGTLSSGVEIAVTSTEVKSVKDWSKHFEGQFRKKIDVLSKVNHKNFVNLLGFCEEEEPFTRMMVFEYAPNGTLFEHLHIKEAEHLDWGVRLRIAMGMSYCLEHMHQLTPPVIHKNLQSNSVYLTEDYAAKISDIDFWNEATAAKMGSAGAESSVTPLLESESNVYSFGVILLEMITGRLPYCKVDGPLVEWASDYLRKKRPVRNMVDSTLKYFKEEELEKLCEVIRSCINDDPKQRPAMREVTAQLREITAVTPDGATPKLSPLWWAELEILSTEAT